MAVTDQLKKDIEEITPAEAALELDQGDVALIDTREPHEYDEAHLEGGRLVPPGLLRDEIGSAVPDRSKRVVLYCRSGNRSATAAAEMKELGYEDVASIAG